VVTGIVNEQRVRGGEHCCTFERADLAKLREDLAEQGVGRLGLEEVTLLRGRRGPRSRPVQLVVQTLLGSAALLAEGDAGPEAVRAAVTSPGGTTAAGLRSLEAAGVRAAFLDAVAAATARSRELGRPAPETS